MSRKLTLALLAVCTLAAGGCVQATRDFTFTRPWDNYERIVVRTANGRVRLAGGHVDELRVTGRTRARGATFAAAKANLDAIEVVAQPDERQPATLQVVVHVPENLRNEWSGTDLEIGVPTACAARIETSNAPIYVVDAKDCALQTSNALIDVERIGGRVDAGTSNGRIKALCVTGDLIANSSNGAIQVDSVQGNCRLTTSNAPIKILAAGGDVDATTSNGPIRLEAATADRSETGPTIELRTSNGPITLLLPRQLAGELSLVTSNAPVRARLLHIAADIHRQTEGALQATLNGGGPARVVAETANGPIRVDFR